MLKQETENTEKEKNGMKTAEPIKVSPFLVDNKNKDNYVVHSFV